VTGFSAENSVKLTLLANRIVTNRVVEAQDFLNSSMKQGHEGIVAKALNSHYTSGTWGKQWFKI
jgi:DNA ligase-1